MSKFSVKKPLTIFVVVIAIIVLGIVSYSKMTPDLLPNMDFPYVLIMTTYPGASPEKVEAEVTKPMEQSKATLEYIKTVSSSSGEKYSMVILEFEDGVDLNAIGLDIQQNITSLQGTWGDTVAAPYVLKINPSMLPVMVAAVSKEGLDSVALTEYLDTELIPKLEGISGVARISTSGTIRQQAHIVLDQEKIDAANQKIADAINGKMDEALDELSSTRADLVSAQNQLASGKQQLQNTQNEVTGQLAAGETELAKQLEQLNAAKTQIETTLPLLQALDSGLEALKKPLSDAENRLATLKELKAEGQRLDARQKEMADAISEILSSGKPQEEIDQEIAQLQSSEAYLQLMADQSDYDAKLAANGVSADTLDSQILLAENTLTSLQQRLQELQALLEKEGLDEASLKKNIQQMEDGLNQVTAGLAALEEARQTLSQQKMTALLGFANAATELSVNAATVSGALQQVDGGINTLEDTREKTLQQVDLRKILTMDMLKNILVAQNFSMPAGTVEQDSIRYMVSVGDEITTAEDLQGLLLFDAGVEGVAPVYLSDVAAVMVTDNRDETYARLGKNHGVILSFEKQSTYATADVTDHILARFESLEKTNDGLQFVPLMNQGDYIYMIVQQILSSLLFGAIFAILILLVFLKDLRPTFITLCSIPISVIFAIVLMYFSGVTINMMSLSGLAVAVGMLVDNSVVVIENIYRLRSKGATVLQAAVSGAKQVAGAVTASTLTTVCVFLPIVFVTGLTRQLFVDLALTMTYALLASLIVSLTLVPAMAAGLLKKEKQTKTRVIDKFLNLYEKSLRWSLGHKAVVLLLAVALLIGSGMWSLSKGFQFMPEMDMPSVTITVTMPEGASMAEATELADQVMERVATVDGISTAGAMMGTGMSLDSLAGSTDTQTATIYINLTDEKGSGAAVGKQIENLCADLPCTVSASSEMIDMSMLTGSGISLRIYADDMDDLQQGAKEAAKVLATVPGVAEVSDGLEEAVPALHISIDRNKAMKEGITVAQIYMDLAAALQTETTAATLTLNGTSTEVIIEKPEETVLTVDALKDYVLEFATQTGEQKSLPLKDIATVEEAVSLSTISRLEQRRYLNVTATLEEGVNITLTTTRAQTAMKAADLGSATYEFDGENEAIMEAISQLALMLLLGVLLVYLVMGAQFQSLKSPFIVMFTIPLAFTGGFIALLLCGMEISIVSLVGFIMLTGIIVNNGIVLVDYINQLRQEGMERRAAIVEAGKTRMRPILMTTVTTVLGLLVTALSKNAGNAMMRPLAVVCIGGLTYATVMTLYIVPAIYDMMNKKELRVVKEEDIEDVNY